MSGRSNLTGGPAGGQRSSDPGGAGHARPPPAPTSTSPMAHSFPRDFDLQTTLHLHLRMFNLPAKLRGLGSQMRSREMSEEATLSIYYYITTPLRTKMKIPRDPNGAESSSITWQAQRIKTQQNRHHPSIQDERNLARCLGRREQPICLVSPPRHSLAGGHLGLSSGVPGILGIKATCQQCGTGREEAQALRVPGKSQITCSAGREVGVDQVAGEAAVGAQWEDVPSQSGEGRPQAGWAEVPGRGLQMREPASQLRSSVLDCSSSGGGKWQCISCAPSLGWGGPRGLKLEH